ncbi:MULTISPECIES: hypothetical protein [Streptomyces]|uniref:Uncharacterized protein n=1 Tax=Streptomyces nodosus TaxID=40318 RepID=A0A0B5D7T1_9ACTN|nr:MULTISPECIES: hypothetical protein [Streptomyces]AJE39229.1 hypothetical protein SNOD_03710 [Streptomyces nodosus]MBB4790131.1 hypothetical protein [Streptomyces nodosus]MYV49802.1 hypothetical protein [Streptomyces sp. SID2888]QEV37827.1 hypothetical protein CP978_04100 [Streptomyces nodosus]
MSTSQPEASRRPSDDRATPDELLHVAPAQASPDDLVLASGRDMSPSALAWAERKLASEGRAALDKLLP